MKTKPVRLDSVISTANDIKRRFGLVLLWALIVQPSFAQAPPEPARVPTADWPRWSPVVRSFISPGGQQPDSNGDFNGLFQTSGGGLVHLNHLSSRFANRNAGGDGFVKAIASLPGTFSQPQIVGDNMGQLHAFFLHGGDLYWVKRGSDHVWGAPVLLVDVTSPGIAIRAIAATFQEPSPAYPAVSSTVYCYFDQNGGTSDTSVLRRFNATTGLIEGTSAALHTADEGPFLVAHRGHLLRVIADDPPPGDDPAFWHIAPDGTSLLLTSFDDTLFGSVGPCAILVDPTGQPHFSWKQLSFVGDPTPELVIRRSLSAPNEFVFGVVDGAVHGDHNGTIHRFFSKSSAGLHMLSHSIFDPVTSAWSPEIERPVESMGADLGFAIHAVTLDDANRFGVVFSHGGPVDLLRRWIRMWDDNLGDQGPLAMHAATGVSLNNLTNGNAVAGVDLFACEGHGPQLEVSLTYNSLDLSAGACGRGWRHSLMPTLDVYPPSPDPKHSILTMPDGRKVVFKKDPTLGIHIPTDDYGLSLKLSFEGTGETTQYTIESPEGIQWKFDDFGKLKEIRDRDGNNIILAYADNPATPGVTERNLTSAVDSHARTISFEYDSRSRVTKIIDPGGAAYDLLYDEVAPGGDPLQMFDSLTTVGLPDSGAGPRPWTFSYHPSFGVMGSVPAGMPPATQVGMMRGALASIRRPVQAAGAATDDCWLSYEISKLHFGKLKEGWEPGVGTVSRDQIIYSYVYGVGTPTEDETTITTWNDNPFVYTTEYKRGIVLKIVDPVNSEPTTFVYDSRRNVTTATDPGLHATTYVYSGASTGGATPAAWVKDSVMSVLLPGDSTATVLTYDATLNVVTSVTPPGGSSDMTAYLYDTEGHLTSITLAGTPAPPPIVMAYDGPGRLTSSTDPEGGTTTFAYVGATYGLPSTVTIEGTTLETKYTYTSMGQIETEETPSDGLFTYEYDSAHQLTKKILPGSPAAAYKMKYDADGLLVEIYDPDDPSSPDKTISRHERGWIVGVEDADGESVSADLDAEGNPTKITGRGDEQETTCEWDALGRCTKNVRKQGGSTGTQTVTTETNFTPSGKIDDFTVTGTGCNAFSRTTNYTYDARDFVETENVEGRVTKFYRDANGRLTAEELQKDGAFFRGTGYERDDQGRVTKRWQLSGPSGGTAFAGRETTFEYDDAGNVTKTTSPAGRTMTYEFDAAGRETKRTDETGVETRTVYAPGGQLEGSEIRVPGHSGFQKPVKNTYDERGRLWKVSDNVNPSDFVENEYDAAGRMTRVTGPLGLDRKMEYDELGQMTHQETRRAPGSYIVNDFDHDVQGNVSNFYPAPGKGAGALPHHFAFDADNRLTDSFTPLFPGISRTMGYDSNGHMCSLNDEDGMAADFERNVLGELTKSTYAESGGPTTVIDREYDEAGNLLSVMDSDGDGVIYEYKPVGGADPHTNEVGKAEWFIGFTTFATAEYDYDDDGLRKKLRIRNSGGTLTHTFEYFYDAAGRMTSMTVNGSTMVSMSYEHGFLTSVTHGNGLVAERFYDKKGRLERTTYAAGTGSPTSIEYDYDKRDRRTSAYYGHLDLLSSFEYDDVGWLTKETHLAPSGGPPPGSNAEATVYGGNESDPSATVPVVSGSASAVTLAISYDYTYDDRGNRLSKVGSDGSDASYAYDINDRLTSETRDGVPITYAYTTRGDLTSRTSGGTTATFGTDALGRMTTFASAGTSESYSYWPTGPRKHKEGGGTNEHWLPDGDETLADWTKVGATSYALSGVYVSTGLDQKAARIDAGGAATYLWQDGLGSVHQLASAAGTVLKTNFTDAWGNDVALTALPPLMLGPIDRWLFTGREKNAESGLYDYRARSYDPAVGRFLSRDPVWHGNLFLYVGNDPVNKVDPFGKEGWFKSVWDEYAPAPLKEVVGHFAGEAVKAGENVSGLVSGTATAVEAGYNAQLDQVDRMMDGLQAEGRSWWEAYSITSRVLIAHQLGYTQLYEGAIAEDFETGEQLTRGEAAWRLLQGGAQVAGSALGAQQALFKAGRYAAGFSRARSPGTMLNEPGATGGNSYFPGDAGPNPTTIRELLRTGAVPGSPGVTLNQTYVNFSDLWKLTRKHKGIEFGLARRGKQFRLYSGGHGAVRFPPGERIIAHTHPSRNPLPSRRDQKALNDLYDQLRNTNPGARAPHARIVHGPGPRDSRPYYPENR